MFVTKKYNAPKIMTGILAVFTLLLMALAFFVPVLLLGLAKLAPQDRWKMKITRVIDTVIVRWISLVDRFINQRRAAQWQIDCPPISYPQQWQLVIANHQSWTDVFVLQHLFNQKMPIMKFFIKDALKWIPLFGFAWWAMGCPFVKRYSKEKLVKKPHKKGCDMAKTQKAMRWFIKTPVTVANFVEGTRFSACKKEKQDSPYQHLLKPKTGGIAFSVQTLSRHITKLIDVTIVYEAGRSSFWDFLCHRTNKAHIIVREIPIPPSFLQGTLLEDKSIKNEFAQWISEQWAIKDQLVASASSCSGDTTKIPGALRKYSL